MKTLWAPWRLQYISSKKPKGCVFCKLKRQKKDGLNLILKRYKHCYLVLNKFPYNNAHLMVVPSKHTSDIEKLSSVEQAEMMSVVTQVVCALKKAYKPQAFNVGMNLGREAGAGIAEHLHMHVVPRWNGDTNFMALLGETKMIPDHLQNTYKKLLKYF